jgi:hypothetical protein
MSWTVDIHDVVSPTTHQLKATESPTERLLDSNRAETRTKDIKDTYQLAHHVIYSLFP